MAERTYTTNRGRAELPGADVGAPGGSVAVTANGRPISLIVPMSEDRPLRGSASAGDADLWGPLDATWDARRT